MAPKVLDGSTLQSLVAILLCIVLLSFAGCEKEGMSRDSELSARPIYSIKVLLQGSCISPRFLS